MGPPPKKQRRIEEGESYSPAAAERNGDPREPLPEGPGWESRDGEGKLPPPKSPEQQEEFEKALGEYLRDWQKKQVSDYWHPPWMQGELPPAPRNEWEAISPADVEAARVRDLEEHYLDPNQAPPGPYVAPRPWGPPQQWRDSPFGKLQEQSQADAEYSEYLREQRVPRPPPLEPQQPPPEQWSPEGGWPNVVDPEDMAPPEVLPRVPGMYAPLSEPQWKANRRLLLRGWPLAPEGLDPELYFRENQQLLPPHLRETEDQKKVREAEERTLRNRNRF